MSTTAVVVPSNIQLPAHLQRADVVAQIAAANAAAAGGVRAGGFPSISLKANKFSIRDGGETTALMNPPAAPGQPALPMMCLEVVVVDANPALSHTFFEGEYVEGENQEPACRSANGAVPDTDAPKPQNAACATCPQYQWGSAVSKLTGKEIRACTDSKQLAVLPAGDLAFKMLGLQVGPGSLTNWGKYIQALSGRGYGVSTLVTNITFDQAKTGVLEFSFNRFLTEDEYNKVNERKAGEDVKVIVAQSRTIAAAPAIPALPAPAAAQSVAAAQPAAVISPVAAQAAPAAAWAFGDSAAVPDPAVREAENAAMRAALDKIPVVIDPYAGQPPHVEAAVTAAGGLDSPAGAATYKALTGKDAPAAEDDEPEADPFAGLPPHVKLAVDAAGGLGTAAGDATFKALAPTVPAPSTEPPKRKRRTRAEIEAEKAAQAPAAAPAQPAVAPVAPAQAATPAGTGFGAQVAAPAATPQAAPQQATAQVAAAGASLAEKLRAKLGLQPQ